MWAAAARRASTDIVVLLGLAVVLAGLLAYTASPPPTRLDFALDQIPGPVILRGFYGVERNAAGPFRWAKPEAGLVLPVGAPGAYRVTITAQDVAAGPPRPLRIGAGGETLATVQLDGTPRAYNVDYHLSPRDWLRGRPRAVVVELAAPAFVPEGDPRALGPILSRVAIAPTGGRATAWLPVLPAALLLLGAAYAAARLAGLRPRPAALAPAAALAGYGALAALDRAAALRLACEVAVRPIFLPGAVAALAALPALVTGRGGWAGPAARPWPAFAESRRGALARLGARPIARWLPLATVVALGAGLRFYRLDALSLWLDEGATVDFTNRPWPVVLGLRGYYSTHPPLYYVLVKGVSAVVSDALAGRLVSAVAGTATIPVLYALVARLANRRAALAAALVLALSPLHIWYSQEGRMYATVTLLVAVSYLALAAFQEAPSRRWVILYGLSLVLAMYVDYSAAHALAPQVLLLALIAKTHRRRAVMAWLAAIGAALAYLPWLPRLAATMTWVGDGRLGLDATPAHIASSLLSVIGISGNTGYFFGSQPTPWDRWPAGHAAFVLGAATITALGVAVLVRRPPVASLVAGSLSIGTVMTAAALSSISPSYAERTILATTLGWAILCGAAGFGARAPKWRNALGLLGVICILTLSGVTLRAIHRGADLEHWRDVAADVALVSRLGQPILTYSEATKTLVDVYQPQVAAAGQLQVVDDKVMARLARDDSTEDALWVVYSDQERGVRPEIQERLTALGYERIMHRYYWHPLFLDLYALPGAHLGHELPINGGFEGQGSQAAGWQMSPDGIEYSPDDRAGRRLTITNPVAGLRGGYFVIKALPRALYTLELEARSGLAGGGLDGYLTCVSSSGTWSSVAFGNANGSVPRDGAWHAMRIATVCPTDTSAVRIDLRNTGVGEVSYRGLKLWESFAVGENLLPITADAAVSISHLDQKRWILAPNATRTADQTAFRLAPAGAMANVTLTTQQVDPGKTYALRFRYRNAGLTGEQRVFVSTQNGAGAWLDIFPDGAGYPCLSTDDWATGAFAFTVPAGADALTIWLRATGSGSAEFTEVELREIE